jgi:hypothetical protein
MAIQFDNTNTGVATLKPATSGTLALTLPSADGTNGQALTTNGSGQLSFATPSGGVTGFTGAESTAAPNATVYVDSLTSSASSTNADVAFVAKNFGATLAQVPDSTTAGGNKRGVQATDWQKTRGAATQVASGAYSTVSGGGSNTASNSYAAVAGGILNNASGLYSSSAGGYNNTISGDYAFVGNGFQNTSSALVASICGGESNIASSTHSFVGGGFTNKAQTGTYAAVVGGANNTASGQYSFIGGGGDAVTATNRNTASGANSAVVGGAINTASAIYTSIGGGYQGTASTQYGAISGGYINTASGSASFVGGGGVNTASNTNSSVVGGGRNISNGVYSFIAGGNYGTARGITGYHVFPASASPIASANGVMQASLLILGRETTDATATVLTSDINAGSTTNQVILPNNSAYYFKGSITAGVTGAGNSSMWSFEGGIKRGANAAATTLIQSTINLVAQDAGASAWVVALSADTTNGGIAVTVTGAAATTIRWVCKIETTEMTF